MKLHYFSALLLSFSLSAGGVHAQTIDAPSGRLEKIKKEGRLTLGVRDASIPFSYLSGDNTYVGYSIDLCHKAADAIQKHLGLAKLDIHMVPVNSASRIPLIANGTIDLSCDSATNNEERQKQVSFSPTYYVTGTRLLAKKSSGITKLDDLKGKTLVSTSGTANLKLLTELNAQHKLGIRIMPAKDHAEAFLNVETGRAVAFGMDDVLLAALAANAKAPQDYVITEQALSIEPYGLIEPKNDPVFKKVVDDALIAVYTSPEIEEIYNKWFMSPIPPKGINLNMPMSPELKAVFAHPTDSGNPRDYQHHE